MKFIIFIFLFQVGNIFAQTLNGDNYTIQPLDKDCKCGFYLNKYFDPPNPFAPQPYDFDFQFGLAEFSTIEINIFSEKNKDTIVRISNKLPKGCYQLHWYSQNFANIEVGEYYCSILAQQATISTYSAIQKIHVMK